MATALTIAATNPLANPLKTSNYAVRRKPSYAQVLDGASMYPRKNSFASSPSSPLANFSYSIPSPVLVVKPSIPTSQPASPKSPRIAVVPISASPMPTSPLPTSPSTTNVVTQLKAPGRRLSYAEVVVTGVKSPITSPVLRNSPTLRGSGSSLKHSSPASSPSITMKSHKSNKMDRKLNFEAERAKLKARRLAKRGFEKQTGKAWDHDVSQQEWEIYQEQVKRHEEAILQQRQEEDAATTLANAITQKEASIQQLQKEMGDKIKMIEQGKDELERFRLDFEESIKAEVPSSSSAEKSAAVRMREEQARKKLRAAWRNNPNPEDPTNRTRRNILLAQEDVAALNMRINGMKKELAKMKEIAERERSAKVIMRAEKHQREEMKRKGIEKPKAAPKPKLPPPAPVLRSHQLRLAEQKALKEKARAARASSSSSSSSTPRQAP